jgi:hypothetical protein
MGHSVVCAGREAGLPHRAGNDICWKQVPLGDAALSRKLASGACGDASGDRFPGSYTVILSTFDRLKADPKPGRAQALRRGHGGHLVDESARLDKSLCAAKSTHAAGHRGSSSCIHEFIPCCIIASARGAPKTALE